MYTAIWIAANVALSLKTLYPHAYVPVTYNSAKAAHFFNNAEGELIWGQMQTLTDERSYSGKKSSKTWYKQEYSMAFEYPVSHLTDSMQKITVRMKLYQQNNNHEAKLMFVVIDKEGKQESAEVRINDLTNTVDAWSEVSHTFTLPQQFYNGDLVKVFVHNPYRTAIYLDDMDMLLTR